MKDILFDTSAKREAAISQLNQLKSDPGWLLVCQILQANIDVIKDALIHGGEAENIESIKLLRDRLLAYENLVSTPERFIKQLEANIGNTPTMDPFMTLAELKKLRNEAT